MWLVGLDNIVSRSPDEVVLTFEDELASRAACSVEQIRSPSCSDHMLNGNGPIVLTSNAPAAHFEIVAGPNDGFTFSVVDHDVIFEGEVLGPPPGSRLGSCPMIRSRRRE